MVIWAVLAIGPPVVWIFWIDVKSRRVRRRQIAAGLAALDAIAAGVVGNQPKEKMP